MEQPPVVHSIDLIVSSPNVRSGRPVVRGTTIPVADIAIVKIYHQQDADGLADWFGLSLPQVYAALSYYYARRDEIDAHIRSRREQAETLKEQRVGSRHPPLFG